MSSEISHYARHYFRRTKIASGYPLTLDKVLNAMKDGWGEYLYWSSKGPRGSHLSICTDLSTSIYFYLFLSKGPGEATNSTFGWSSSPFYLSLIFMAKDLVQSNYTCLSLCCLCFITPQNNNHSLFRNINNKITYHVAYFNYWQHKYIVYDPKQ